MKAATYGEKAFIIVTEQGSKLGKYKEMLSIVFQWLGVVNGEIALESLVRQERSDRQNEAILYLEKARSLNRENAYIRYQLALQLAEVGDVNGNS
jgi:hypothetical protein